MNELIISLGVIFLSFSLTALSAETLTYEKFLEKIGAGERQIDYSQGLINHRKLHQLITDRSNELKLSESKKDEKESVDGMTFDAPVSTDPKINSSSGVFVNKKVKILDDPASLDFHSATVSASLPLDVDASIPERKMISTENAWQGKEEGEIIESVETVVQYVYVPPSLRNAQREVSNEIQMMTPDRSVLFGITIGTHISVKLSTGASNVQPGYVQLIVQSDVVGDKKTLVKGSTIFCRANAVLGSPRLYTSAVRGITGDGHTEFNVKGNVFANDGRAGFLAEIISDGRGLARAKDAGISALGTGLLGMVPNVNIAAGAGKAAAAVVMDENNEDNRVKNGRLNYVLEAAPQLAILQIEETF